MVKMNTQKVHKPKLNSNLRFVVLDAEGYMLNDFRTYRAAEICKGAYETNSKKKAQIVDTLTGEKVCELLETN